ncbi:MAG: anaerobic ribonucleoside-triphosphate reductase activating protein [Actinomycetaceae bacterium]|nr:anaerobic ribonucleoside-triphosphate reductase activating protein [Actinomycetaceae bacterium]
MTVVEAQDLQIAGLAPMSTVDWPGKLVATVFTQGCPWACGYCHNHAIIDPQTPGIVPWDEVIALMKRRRGLLDGVVFSGGEATRQAALIQAAAEIKRMGFKVGLHTAGPYPRRLEQLLGSGLIDWVGMDVKATVSNYPSVVGRANSGEKAFESLKILLDAVAASGGDLEYEIRLTAFPSSPGVELEVARLCLEAGVKTFALQQARSEGAPEDFQADMPGWQDQFDALARDVEALGFEDLIVRRA